MKHFTIEELCRSDYAERTGLKNIPTPEIRENLKHLIEHLLDPLRERWGKAIVVNSGYRNEYLNKQLNGAKNSQHTRGEAVDLTAGNAPNNKALFELIRDSGLVFDQLIDERNYTWLHVSLKPTNNRNQILHL